LRIAAIHSHLNGLEYLEARRRRLWSDIRQVIAAVNASACLTKISAERRTQGAILYSPKALNREFGREFNARQWNAVTTHYWVCEDAATNRAIVDLPRKEQRERIEQAGLTPIPSKNQTDFVKDGIAVEVQFGKYSFIAYDLFVKHMAFYVAGQIDVGVEVIPMKSLQAKMSSGPGYYEAELFNLVREGRGVPPVPLVLIGVEP
jgi:hypothetical protein